MKALLALLIAFAPAVFADALYDDQGLASFKVTQGSDGLEYEQTAVEYVVGYGMTQQYIFKAVTNSKWADYTEGLDESTEVIAWGQNPDGSYVRQWSIIAPGSDFKALTSEVGTLTESGCCGAANVNRVYRLNDGLLLSATLNETLMQITAPNSGLNSRYLAQVVDEAAPETENGKVHLASIGYFSDASQIGLVRIYGALPEGWGTDLTEVEPVFEGQNYPVKFNEYTLIELWESEGKTDASEAFEKFGFKGAFYYGDLHETFTINVKGDKLDEASSTFSADLTAVFVN